MAMDQRDIVESIADKIINEDHSESDTDHSDSVAPLSDAEIPSRDTTPGFVKEL